MENLLVSACLAGFNTKYNGKNNYTEKIEALRNKYNFIYICPEVMGGLSTPRYPSEIRDSLIINSKEEDVTSNFILGAQKAVEIVKENHITKALLKDGSPSCGSKTIYDGTFTGVKIKGYGITAELLRENGVALYTENDIDKL